ncbi:MAG TPA: hypothetical protein VMK42_06400 [Anaeromyxobacteraceae bacterium]|nr:hypothetical protein [Anaeromyxobacteraceae bacterium]
MNRLPRIAALALPALALASCATTHLVQAWRDPNYQPAPVRRVFVVAVVPDPQYRVSFENGIARSLLSRGFEVATSSGVFPPNQLEDAKVEAFVREMNVDLVVVQRLGPYDGGYGYGSYGRVVADTNVYAAKNPEVPVWSGSSTTINYSSAEEAAASAAASLVYDLINAHILVH